MSGEPVSVRSIVDEVASAVAFHATLLGSIRVEDPSGNLIELLQPAG